MARIVVVEEREQPRIAELLAAEGLTVERTPGTGDVLAKLIANVEPDVVVLELASTSRSAIRWLEAAQAVTRAPLALFLEFATEREIVAGYAAGAHSVIVEPVGPYELIARIRAVLRRAPPKTAPTTDIIVVGPVVLDRARRQVTVAGQIVAMPRKEFEIAELLMQQAGGVVSRTQLVRQLWGSARDTKTLDVQVGRLRAKLAAAEGRRRLLTVRGVGYRFATDDDLDHEAPIQGSRVSRATST